MGKCSRDLADLLSLWQVTAFLEVVNVYCPLQRDFGPIFCVLSGCIKSFLKLDVSKSSN